MWKWCSKVPLIIRLWSNLPDWLKWREEQGYLQHRKGLIHPWTWRSAKLGNAIGLFCINKQECWKKLNIFIKQNIMIPETLRNSTNAFKWRFYLSPSCKKESLMRCHLNSNTCLMAVFLYPQRVTVYECLQFSKCIYKNCFFINNVMPFFLICYSCVTTYDKNCWLWHFCIRYVSKIVLFHTLKLKIL